MQYDISKSINTLKAQRGLSNYDISVTVGKNPSTISGWINGASSPKLSDVSLLCEKSKVLLSEFIKWGE